MSVNSIRVGASLTLAELAKIAGINFSTIATYDNKRTAPPADKALLIIDAINLLNANRAKSKITLDELYDGQITKARARAMIKSKLIKLSKTFSFECDGSQWILHEYKAGMSKQKTPIVSDKRTYHGTLLQACQAVINKRCNDCNDVNAIIRSIEQSNIDLIKAIDSMKEIKE